MSDHDPGARRLPIGTVTFLRTDVEGSMALARRLGPRWDDVVGRHLDLLRHAVADHGGQVVRTEGDGMFAAFQEAGAAVAAAVEAQRALATAEQPDGVALEVRMGLHSGEAHLAGDDYGGFDVNRAARVAAAGHGGQIVVSDPTAALVADALPQGVSLVNLGRHRLRGVPRPEVLWQVRIPGLRESFPPLRVETPTSGNLPDRLTSFLGREAELDDIVALLGEARLVTLTGPGGIGKSSLAVEAARRVAADFADGAWLVTLDELDEHGRVTATIARTLGLFDGPSRTAADALPEFLADRVTLLVLDNFEHVLDAAPDVATLLRSSPTSRILITSRAPLRIRGEHEVPLRPLEDGAGRDDGGTARRLFIERARAVAPGWDPGGQETTIDAVCALLDGLPLGIELAAARIGLMPVAAIRDRLQDRLPLPGSSQRDAPARQRTLDGAVAWSHDLLTDQQRGLLHALAVFDGDFDVEQVAAVAGEGSAPWDVLDGIAGLVEHSLVTREQLVRHDEQTLGAEDEPPMRFRLLRTIQSFALARLAAEGREEAMRLRHAKAFLALAEAAAPHMTTRTQARWLARLQLDATNLRSAVRWAIDAGEVELAQRAIASLWRFWQADGRLNEGRILATEALAMPGGEAMTAARLWAVGAAGSIAYWQADLDESQRRYDEQLAIALAIGEKAGIADAYFNIGHLVYLYHQGGPALLESEARTRRAYEALGDERGLARVEWALGTMALGAGKPEDALATFDAVRSRFEALGDAQYHAMTTASMSWASFTAGDIPAACRYAVQGIVETYAMRDVGTTTISLHVGVLMADILHRFEDAARLTGAFDALCERYGVRPPAALGRFIETQDPFTAARDGVGSDEAWARLYAEGRRMDLETAVALIVDIGGGFDEPGDRQ